jgi:hypothetical protein
MGFRGGKPRITAVQTNHKLREYQEAGIISIRHRAKLHFGGTGPFAL